MNIGFRLRKGRDDDLITMLKRLPEYERSFYIRQALREYFNCAETIPVLRKVKVKPDVVREPIKGTNVMTKEEAEKILDKINF